MFAVAAAQERLVPRALVSLEGLPARAQFSPTTRRTGSELFNAEETPAIDALNAKLEALDLEASLELRNNAALAYLVRGDTHVADVALAGLASWCGEAAVAPATIVEPCLAIFKNWCWALAARDKGGDHALWGYVREWAVARTTAALRGAESQSSSALSVYDVGIERRTCHHESLAPPPPVCLGVPNGDVATRLADPYLDLVRRSLTNFVHADFEADDWKDRDCGPGTAVNPVSVSCEHPWTATWRASGVSGLATGAHGDEAERARRRYHTTLSAADLVHLELLVRALFDDDVPGHLLEAGVFRGGACIFLRALLATLPGEQSRQVYVADSFAGIPKPRRSLPGDREDPTADWDDRFAFGEAAVKYNFRRYGLLDARVHFVPGFFNDSLPPLFGSISETAPRASPPDAPTVALLRIDADAFDGVLDALDAVYPHLSPGGAVVIDDWHLGGARAAVHLFRRRHNITAPILPLPSDYVYTCKPDLRGLAACLGADQSAEARNTLLYDHNKHLITGIGQHGAYWRKAHDEIALSGKPTGTQT
ncbi:hypothetical protein CTAYLR_007775 [Chrysophaeum taylorii]|uniref:Macrocin O-methyltransferase n=1 Tax=Chrysophaeum taylorii TaxID=2483200 RepID=A0AAD7UL80_9STRA|nr:hypothetical protein CTAYLR_007775 [Chrysophaeum taylorii]